ncbi:MAG: hypothetical protein V4580_18135 [Bacteroidota bacterium]
MNQKPKIKSWKKIAIISIVVLISFIIIANLFMDKYKLGLEAYNKKDYGKAYLYLKQIDPENKDYTDAKIKATESKAKLDSLGRAEVIAEKLKEQQKAIEEEAKLKSEELNLKQEKIKQGERPVKLFILDRQTKIDDQFSSWDGSHKTLTKYVKDNMNDPDSYEHVETKYYDMKDHLIIITKFRGANSLGGKVLNSLKAKVDLEGKILEIIE